MGKDLTRQWRADQMAALRAADADRQEVVDHLKAALEEGRLSLAEYDERVRSTYAARTYAELLAQIDDLPRLGVKTTDVQARASAEARRAARRLPMALMVLWTIWAAIGAVNVAIWALADVTVGGGVYAWPVWVVIPPGVALLAVTVGVQTIRRQHGS